MLEATFLYVYAYMFMGGWSFEQSGLSWLVARGHGWILDILCFFINILFSLLLGMCDCPLSLSRIPFLNQSILVSLSLSPSRSLPFLSCDFAC
jgi:hypothetical protein